MSQTYPFVSVIVPVYNEADELPGLIASLAALDWPADRLEILCVDNGSKDNSRELLSLCPRIRVLQEAKPGSYAARNRAIRESRGELIAFTDADCTVDPNWIKELVAGFEGDPTVGAVGGTIVPQPATNAIDYFEGSILHNPSHGRGTARVRPYLVTANAMYRRAVFDRLGLFDEGRFSGRDVEMSWRMLTEGTWTLRILEDGRARVLHRCRSSFREFAYVRRRTSFGWYHLTRQYPQMAPVPRLERYLARVLIAGALCPFTTLGRLGLALVGRTSFRDVPRDLLHFTVQWNHLLGTARAQLTEAGWQPSQMLR